MLQNIINTLLLALPMLKIGVDKQTLHSSVSIIHQYSYCYMNTTKITSGEAVLLLILPRVFNGLAQVLVNMTVLEFLCAQAPHSLQGLLIGLWYAMFSI